MAKPIPGHARPTDKVKILPARERSQPTDRGIDFCPHGETGSDVIMMPWPGIVGQRIDNSGQTIGKHGVTCLVSGATQELGPKPSLLGTIAYDEPTHNVGTSADRP
jgi:hypothetical protein